MVYPGIQLTSSGGPVELQVSGLQPEHWSLATFIPELGGREGFLLGQSPQTGPSGEQIS